MKDAYYFSHDNNARNDLKVKAMISKYGYEGYGIFWALVEMMHESGEGELPLEEYLYIAVQREFNGSSTDVQQFINDCITVFKLFESDGERFWSNSLKRRMEMREKRREQARKAGKKSAQARQKSTVVEQPLSDSSTESNKGKERKEKGKENKDHLSLFDYLWNLYPKKRGKGQVSETQKKKLLKIGQAELEKCIERYKQEMQGKDSQYMKNGSTFFNTGYVDYLDENYEPKDGKVLEGWDDVNMSPTVRAYLEEYGYEPTT